MPPQAEKSAGTQQTLLGGDNQPSGKEFKAIKPKKDESVYQLAVGDPALITHARKVTGRLADDPPEGCDVAQFRYIWVHANPEHITPHTRALIDEAVGQPVSPDNHPQIPARLFSGDKIIHGDAMLWYFHKETAIKHFADRREFAVNLFRRAQGVGQHGTNEGTLDSSGVMRFGHID